MNNLEVTNIICQTVDAETKKIGFVKINLTQRTRAWLKELGITTKHYLTMANEAENENYVVAVYENRAAEAIYNIIHPFIYPIQSRIVEILGLADDPEMEVTETTPIRIFVAYRKEGKLLDLDKVAEPTYRTIISFGFENANCTYTLNNNEVRFDPRDIYRQTAWIDTILPNHRTITDDGFSFISILKDLCDPDQLINSYKVPLYGVHDKMKYEYEHENDDKLYHVKLWYPIIHAMLTLADGEGIRYKYQAGDTQIWFIGTKYVAKLNPYKILHDHEHSMLKSLQSEGFVPKVIEELQFGCQNVIIMTNEGKSLSELYHNEVFIPEEVSAQMRTINQKLKALGLLHIDAHDGNWVMDDNGKVSMIDLEHLIYRDATRHTKGYLRHLDAYFPINGVKGIWENIENYD